MKKIFLLLVSAVLALSACGPANVEQAAQEAASTAEALAPQGVEATANALLNDPTTQALASDAASTLEGIVPTNLRLQRDQALVLDTTREAAGVTNYRWTIAEVPAGAESVQGQVIAENSDGKLTLEPADYAKYFPVAGDYTINLELTQTDGTTQVAPIPLTVP